MLYLEKLPVVVAMSSKLDYLQKYLSKGENLNSEDGVKLKKKKRKKIKAISGKRGGNLAIVDDDVDWRSLVPEDKDEDSAAEDDPEDRPIVAEVSTFITLCLWLVLAYLVTCIYSLRSIHVKKIIINIWSHNKSLSPQPHIIMLLKLQATY